MAPALRRIDLPVLIDDKDAYATFVRQQWDTFVRRSTGTSIEDERVPYILRFEQESELQDDVAGFLRTGVIEPVEVADPDQLPGWAGPGVLAETDDSRAMRVDFLISSLIERLGENLGERRWDDWQVIAREWAELSTFRFDADLVSAPDSRIAAIQGELDRLFLDWLRHRYAALGGQKLPRPHHVHHIPLWLASERQKTPGRRVALVVIDGMSLGDWFVIAKAWRQRHPGWKFDEQMVLAQIPTITAISRQPIVSGRRPAQFADSIDRHARPMTTNLFCHTGC